MAKKAAKTKRKSTPAKPAAKSAAKKAPVAKMPSIKEPLSKSDIIRVITETTSLNRNHVKSVLECLHQVIEKHVNKSGPGVFVMPGLMKITVVKKPARPARKGINPFTGEETVFKARPASRALKIRALKKLKEMAA